MGLDGLEWDGERYQESDTNVDEVQGFRCETKAEPKFVDDLRIND